MAFNLRNVVLATIGSAASVLPEPYNVTAIVILIFAFLVIVYVGHKSAFRQHRHGIFAQWSAPGAFLQFHLSETEKRWVSGAIAMCAGAFAGIALRVALS